MKLQNHGYAKLDQKNRVALGRYTELAPGDFYRVERTNQGVLVLTPVRAVTTSVKVAP